MRPRTRNTCWVVGVMAAAAVIGGAVVGAASPASALPPDGAGSNTPGTSSSVSPSTLTAGGTLSFTLRGFPAGEIAYVKIDDGSGYSNQALQGTGVVYQQKIASNGTVNGTFALPGNIGNGSHWLRFLASKVAPGGDGTIGYTNHSPNFTVTGAAASGNHAASNSAANSSVKNGSSQNQQQQAQQGAASNAQNGSGVATAVPTDGTGATTEPTASETPSASPSATSTDQPSNASKKTDGEGFPFVGAGIFALVLIGGGIALWLALRRKPGSGAANPQ